MSVQGQTTFRVGDQVKVDFGQRKLLGEIVEDRGAIGVHGRHLFQVNIPMDPMDPMLMELSEDEMVSFVPDVAADSSISNDQIRHYLSNGGLVSILQSNIAGGRNQPRAWLCLDQLGNVTHTFNSDRGVIGGETVPFWALQDDKIFRPKEDSVKKFLDSFGLNSRDATAIIDIVGRAP